MSYYASAQYKALRAQHGSMMADDPDFSWRPILILLFFCLCLGLQGDCNGCFSSEDALHNVQPGTPAYQDALEEIDMAKKFIADKVAGGTCTPEDFFHARNQHIIAVMRIGKTLWADRDWMLNVCENDFIQEWHPEPGSRQMEALQWMGDTHITNHIAWRSLADEAERLADLELDRAGVLGEVYIEGGFTWLVRSYFHLIIPALLVMMMKIRKREGSTKAILNEMLLAPLRFILLALAWPVGLIVMSETHAQVRRWRRFKSEFLANKPRGYELSEKDKNIIWQRVMQPILTWEQAKEKLRHAPGKMRRPLIATVLVGSFSLISLSSLRNGSSLVVTVKIVQPFDSLSQSTSDDIAKKFFSIFVAIVVTCFEFPIVLIVRPVKTVRRCLTLELWTTENRARAPPPTAVGITYYQCNSSSAVMQKGVTL